MPKRKKKADKLTITHKAKYKTVDVGNSCKMSIEWYKITDINRKGFEGLFGAALRKNIGIQ